MCDAAVRLVQAADYTNAGTVEFIVDQRRQLLLHRGERPHPGRASGDRDGHRHRPDQVADSRRRRRAAAVHAGRHPCTSGAAIECRINAEDPKRNFQPSPGTIERLIAPGGFGVRFDSHAHSGYVVSPLLRFDDRQADRPPADAAPRRSPACSGPSRELRIEGIKTTVPLHQEILGHAAFVEGRVDTTFIERTFTPAE